MSTAKKITTTAVTIAMLVLFQFITKSFGQLVTGSSVNLLLAAAALLFGPAVSSAAAILSPFLAFLLGVGPAQFALIPAVAAGNLVYVLLISLLGRRIVKKEAGARFALTEGTVLLSAAVKCALLFLLIVQMIGPAFLPEKALPTISAAFGILQFFTAAIGGTLAVLIAPVIRKALRD